MTFTHRYVGAAVLSAFSLACGGGGSSSGGGGGGGAGAAFTGIALPREVSALPTGRTATSALRDVALRTGPDARGTAALSSDSDYGKAQTLLSVSESSLAQFDILNSLFEALAQTHYDDDANLNQGPYSAMVSWVERTQGPEEKVLLKWVVDSTRGSASEPNVVKAWFQMPMLDGQTYSLQVRVSITSAPSRNADGSYDDYGTWTLTAQLVENPDYQFVASAERDAEGRAVLRLGQVDPTSPTGAPQRTRGVLFRTATAGAGKVEAPDRENCANGTCPQQQVTYVYDASIVTLQKDAGAPATKSRTSYVNIVERYGLFDATSGENVCRTRTFSLPVRATIGGTETYGWYVSSQGARGLWANGVEFPEGQIVTRADVQPDASPQYRASRPYTGTLWRRTFAPARLSDITGLVSPSAEFQGYALAFDGTGWCRDPDLSPDRTPRGTCGATSAPFTDFASLVDHPLMDPHIVRIQAPPLEPYPPDLVPANPELLYLTTGPDGAGFYPAAMVGMLSHPQLASDVKVVPVAGDVLWVWFFGPLYISHDGSGWVRKAVQSYDPTTFQPTFLPAGFDQPFELDPSQVYSLWDWGNFFRIRTVGGLVEVSQELLAVAHPWDAASMVPTGASLQAPNCAQPPCSTYEFVSDPASPDFMRLRYLSVAGGDSAAGKQVGDLVDTFQMGLRSTIGGEVVAFDWEYPVPGHAGGTQQFLTAPGGDWVRLDDSIRLEWVELTNASGTRSFSVEFDGNWMQGLPEVQTKLRQNGFELTEPLRQQVYSIPNGQVLGSYVVKQLQVRQYMAPSSAPALDLAEALAIDLESVPAWANNGMGPPPDPAPLKYSEGEPVPGS
jgi:hypothetical protein